jgi:hypothetical protein
MGRRTLALALIASGLLLGLGYAAGMLPNPFALVMALLLFGAGGLLLPGIYRIAGQLRPWLGTRVEATVWGNPLPGHERAALRLHKAFSVGAGLHLYFLPQDSTKPLHMKVAQPGAVVLSGNVLEIGTAKYVQWCGTKIKQAPGEKVLGLQRIDTSSHS